MFIQSVSIQLSKLDPRNLKISKLLPNLFFDAVVFSVFLILAVTIDKSDIFGRYIRICDLENSCLKDGLTSF